MTPLFKKLNFKAHPAIFAINPPASLRAELEAMKSEANIIESLQDSSGIEFILAFVMKQSEVDEIAKDIAPKLKGDAVVWFCYPKGTSKKYKCDFNRDKGWAVLGELNLEPVRIVALDEDWSALRFRKVEYMKKITRRESFALTKEAKERTSQKGK